MASSGARVGRVTRVTAGNVYVELPDVAAGYEFGPVLDTVGGLAAGDTVVVTSLADDEDALVVTGRIGGTRAASIVDGVIALNRLPVAPSGNANATQIVRADDARLSDARTPTAHAHALADLPVAASGVSSPAALVRADDVRLGVNTRPDVAWTEPTLENGWQQYAGGDWRTRYCRLNGIVYGQGLAKTGGASNAVAYWLPVGFRPSQTQMFRNPTADGTTREMYVGAAGDVYYPGGAGASPHIWVNFTFYFPAEQ